MKEYYGYKQIKAKPMNRQEYNDYRGWTLPDDENGDDAGYLVEYTDSPNSNHENHAGYISWSPADVFERAYRKNGEMKSGMAFDAAKQQGHKIQREGWNGRGMWVIYNPGSKGKTAPMTPGSVYNNHGLESVEILPHFDMYTVNASGRRAMLPGWVASQTDLDAEDWRIVE